MNLLLIFLGKFIIFVSRLFNLGYGSTWPGHVALSLNKNFIKEIINKNPHLKIILIAGTNGKTTTGKLIHTILEKSGKKVFQNESGANLLNGIASSLLLHSGILCQINYDYAIFEVDENTLPLILKEINNPDFILILNLFRDQLDRYGEMNSILKKWSESLKTISEKTILILNADDPQVASLRSHPKGVDIKFFGLDDKKLATSKTQHAVDSSYCPTCSSKLSYSTIYYSHLGIWKCAKCNNQRLELNQDDSLLYPLPGTYNRYNTIAAVLLAHELGIKDNTIKAALRDFKPAFGRQEDLSINDRKVKIFLSKNPTSFNESLRTIANLNAKSSLIVLNDRIPDGRDVSWIWDVDFEEFIDTFKNIVVSGDRAYDMALRLKYLTKNSNVKNQNYSPRGEAGNSKFKTYEDLKMAIDESLKVTKKNGTLYILPTYSAMLEIRKILIGKKIL